MSRINLEPTNHNAIRVNQAIIIGLLILAFIVNLPVLIGIVSAIMLIGTAFGFPGFYPLYRFLHKLKLIDADILLDNKEPHRFAQGFGGIVLALAFWLFGLHLETIHWLLSWVVVFLAALNLFVGFCMGCALYYWLQRLGVPGFSKAPPPNTIPGQRPRSEV